MADAYLACLLDRCEKARGRIFVAEIEQAVAGFVAVLGAVEAAEPDEDQNPYAYITDVVVLPAYRRRGIGRSLLLHAEKFARTSGASTIRVGVLASNEAAAKLYRALDFRNHYLQLTKRP